MPTHKGQYGRTNGQAYRRGEEMASSESNDKDMNNAEGGNDIGKGGKNIVAIKHSDGPPYHVKHEDGAVSKHDSKEDLMSHLDAHIPSGEMEEDDKSNEGSTDNVADGSKEAIESLLG